MKQPPTSTSDSTTVQHRQQQQQQKHTPAATHEKPVRVRIISLGDVRVGKSCLIKKYCEPTRFVRNHIPTIGVDYGVKAIPRKMNDGRLLELKIDFFDLSGKIKCPPCMPITYSQGSYLLLHFVSSQAIPTTTRYRMNSTRM